MSGFLKHVLSLPFRFFQHRSSGDLLMRFGSSTSIRTALTGQTVSAILDGTLVVVYLAILLTVRPWFGALVLAFGIIQTGILIATTPRLHQLLRRELAATAESQNYLVESLSGIATLKASGGEDRAFAHWSSLFGKQLNISLQRSHVSDIVETARSALQIVAPLLLLWITAFDVLQGTLSVGTMLALNVLAISFLTPLASLVSSFHQVQIVGAHVDRLADVFESSPEQNTGAVADVVRLSGRIEFRNVWFRYECNGPWIVRNVSLKIEPGQKVALVGSTGSGKSTLAKLLLALHMPDEGDVLFDGMPIQQLNYRALRAKFGTVLQDVFLFSGTIRANVAFNDPQLSLGQLKEAASLACIHDEIMAMPMAYETLLSEGGAGLSGGQRQRLAIARALAHRPAVLLLDEATSHLDAVTERKVELNLSALSSTRIVIAHRLSTVRNADLILVLDRGTIVARGSHEELLAEGGLYSTLVRSQLDEPLEPSAGGSSVCSCEVA
jgi:ABC-type bacteriocin/lantibiotic exporter with double-glycine peptidase domain